jgi:hypothetical protein
VSINLFDIPAATSAYIDDQVEVKVNRVTANLQKDEEGTFTVKVTNAPAPSGVRLTEISLHVSVEPTGIVSLKPPGSALLFPRATADLDDPRLSTNDRVDEMFVFFAAAGGDIEPNATLDVGELLELELEFEGVKPGSATINCHIHASVDPDDLFPRSGGTNGSREVTIKS